LGRSAMEGVVNFNTAIQWNQCYNFYMLYEISWVTITIALLIVYFTLLRKSSQPEDGS